MLERVNKKRSGRRLNSYDHQAICGKDNLRDDKRYAWKHSNSASHVWSGETVAYLVSLSDEQYDKARAAYSEHQKAERVKRKEHERK
ncbi:hypothetical protein [Phytoactinopolyspora mesophila]|uniref:EC042-2821-like Restriction Endonuclease-like domain-containing protein n=1 Tax=Phytoactinopolyspora mesophila TaxID=2650750 RepID=A0A7K3M1V0_9ACTN|nr:hypothetical protein [Phytoactinopolyspora mesophila]NDL57017.1 hypothetical protein [Phytoactinopolyspora mesophila]